MKRYTKNKKIKKKLTRYTKNKKKGKIEKIYKKKKKIPKKTDPSIWVPNQREKKENQKRYKKIYICTVHLT